jgi:hypothetical protein
VYAARSHDPIPYVMEADRQSEVKTEWGFQAHNARRSQEYAIRRDELVRKQGLPPAERADAVNKLDREFVGDSLRWVRNFDEEGDLIEDGARLRAIVDDLSLPELLEFAIMCQNPMAMRNAAKNS